MHRQWHCKVIKVCKIMKKCWEDFRTEASTHTKIINLNWGCYKVCLLCKCPPNMACAINTEDPKSQSIAVDTPRIPTGHHCCWKTFMSDPFVLTLGVAVKTSTEQCCNGTKRGKPKYGEKDWDRFFLFRFLSK
jgi:hypothetical protein